MRATRTKQALWTLAALCLQAPGLNAMHNRPVRLAPIPPPHVRITPHPQERRAHATSKPPVKRKLQASSRSAKSKPSHNQHHRTPQLKVRFTTREKPGHRPAPPLPEASHPLDPAPLTSVVSVIRQDSIHPRLEPTDEVAMTPQILSSLYDTSGRLIMPAPLKGSHDILVHQNQMADQDGLARVQDDEDLLYLRERNLLVPIPTSEALRVDDRLPLDRRFCRPWVAHFLSNISHAHYDQFHTPLQVNSAVRTVAFQVKLLRTNGNAAQIRGDAASPHLTGQAIDIAKRGMPQSELAWMRMYLKTLIDQNVIDVEEEFQQACFHLSVYRKYAPSAPNQRIASTHRPLAPAIAAAIE